MKGTASIILIVIIIISLGYIAKYRILVGHNLVQTYETNHYSDSKYGFEFNYPKKYGDVILAGAKRLPVDYVPEADGIKTFANYASVVGLVQEYSNKITFSNLQKTEQYSSTTPVIMEIYIIDLADRNLKNLVASPVNNRNVALLEEKKLLESVPDGYLTKSDTGSYLKKYTTKNGLIVVTNDGVGGLGTSFEKMHQLYDKNLLIEISVTYVPYAYTPEANEQEQYIKGKRGNDYWVAHHDYLNNGKTSQKLRDSFAEAERIVDSLIVH